MSLLFHEFSPMNPFLIKCIRVALVNNIYASIVIHYLYIALCIRHPKLSPSITIYLTLFTLFNFPPDSFPL